MTIFSKTLEKQVKASGKTLSEIAGDLGISVRTLNHYTASSRAPRLEQLTAIADYFSVSLDMLVSGRSSEYKGPTRIIISSNEPNLETAIELVENGLKNTTSKPSPAKKAALIVSVLEHLTEHPKDYSKATIKNMIRLAT